MSASLHQSPSSLKSIHLLRALLREASYLPDETARNYFSGYIVNRFRAYHPRHNASASASVQADTVNKYKHRSFKKRRQAVIDSRTRPMLRKAQKGLNYLKRANLGEARCLEKILYFTYGRIGPRKYRLLETLLKPDAAKLAETRSDPSQPTALQALYFSNKRYLQYFDAPVTSKGRLTIGVSSTYPKLKCVLSSQYENGRALGRQLKRPVMKTPAYNAWERPMPIKRARNNVRRFYAETMTRLLPPLPCDEWDNIYAMIDGTKHVSFKRRRAHDSCTSPASVGEQTSLVDVVANAIALDKPSLADRPAGSYRPHNVDVRFMRRLYSKLLLLCCKLEFDEQRQTWKAIWGNNSKTLNPKSYSMPTDKSLFEGVDAEGRIPKAKSKVNTTKPHIRARNRQGDLTRFPFFAEFLPMSNPVRQDLEKFKKERMRVMSEWEKSQTSGQGGALD